MIIPATARIAYPQAQGSGAHTLHAIELGTHALEQSESDQNRKEFARQFLNFARLADAKTRRELWETHRMRFTRREQDYVETRLARLGARIGEPGTGVPSGLQSLLDGLLVSHRGKVVLVRDLEVVAEGATLEEAQALLPNPAERALVLKISGEGTLERI